VYRLYEEEIMGSFYDVSFSYILHCSTGLKEFSDSFVCIIFVNMDFCHAIGTFVCVYDQGHAEFHSSGSFVIDVKPKY
jgi:hypothetical protein